MSGSSSPPSKRLHPALPPLRWRVWLMAEHPGSLIGGIVLGVGVWGIVRWVTGQGYLGGLAVGVVIMAGWWFFLPISYELNSEGVIRGIGRLRWKIPWEAIGRYEVMDSGVWLLPTPRPSLLEVFRGVYLPWGGYREEVLRQIQHYLYYLSS